jgi:hypothetical protein
MPLARRLAIAGWLGLTLAGAAGCATLSNDTTVCPEYRSLHCLAGAECSMDNRRGCRVCQCNAADRGQSPVPPDQRGRVPEPGSSRDQR